MRLMAAIYGKLRGLEEKAGKPHEPEKPGTRETAVSVTKAPSLIDQYLAGGRIPWSPGYSKFKNVVLAQTIADPDVMAIFRDGRPLPERHGPHLDERVVECPWALAMIRPGNGRILDAGSVLNIPMFLESPYLKDRELVINSLVIDTLFLKPTISYVHGDFRNSILRPGTFDTIVCISTLEHVGMWPIPTPPFEESLAKPQPQKDLFGYRAALRAFRELLAPGGQLLVTIPYGAKEDQDWLQIFDAEGIADIKASFDGACRTETYFRHTPDGWTVAPPESCRNDRYHNFVKQPKFDPDLAAAARAVACLELVKPA